MNMRQVLIQSLSQAVTGNPTGTALLIVAAFGGYRLMVDLLTLSDLIAVTMYPGQLYLPSQRFSGLSVAYVNAVAALNPIYEVLDEKPEITSVPDAVELTNVQPTRSVI